MAKNRIREVRLGGVEDAKRLIHSIFADPNMIHELPAGGVIYLEPHMIAQILSRERMRLISEIRERKNTVGGLAKRLGRHQEHVSRDIHLLQRYGLVWIERRGRESVPTAAQKITITV
jgi:predicted transcriptional regulator